MTTEHNLRNSCSSGNSSDDDGGHAEAATPGTRKGAEPVPHGEGRHPSLTSRRMEYVIEMMGRQATLARLRKSRRLPLTEAAYNGHHEVLQVGQVWVCLSGWRYSVADRALRHVARSLRNTTLRVCRRACTWGKTFGSDKNHPFRFSDVLFKRASHARTIVIV